MAIKKTSKEEILQEAIRLFKIKGYYNCSMANIAEACGLIKGSIYHYFKSKDEIGIESLKFIHNYFLENIFSIANSDKLSDLEKIKIFVKRVDDYFLNSEGGCLLGNLALELSNENLEFKKVIKEYFSDWEDALTKILRNKYGSTQANLFAKEFVSLTQGSIMMMNLYETKKDYLKVGEKLISLL